MGAVAVARRERPGVVVPQFVGHVPDDVPGCVGVVDAVDLRRPQQPLRGDALGRGLVVGAVLDAAVAREVVLDDAGEPVRVLRGHRFEFGVAGMSSVPAHRTEHLADVAGRPRPQDAVGIEGVHRGLGHPVGEHLDVLCGDQRLGVLVAEPAALCQAGQVGEKPQHRAVVEGTGRLVDDPLAGPERRPEEHVLVVQPQVPLDERERGADLRERRQHHRAELCGQRLG